MSTDDDLANKVRICRCDWALPRWWDLAPDQKSGIGGLTIEDLTNATNYISKMPNKSDLLMDLLEAPTNVDNKYGADGWCLRILVIMSSGLPLMTMESFD